MTMTMLTKIYLNLKFNRLHVGDVYQRIRTIVHTAKRSVDVLVHVLGLDRTTSTNVEEINNHTKATATSETDNETINLFGLVIHRCIAVLICWSKPCIGFMINVIAIILSFVVYSDHYIMYQTNQHNNPRHYNINLTHMGPGIQLSQHQGGSRLVKYITNKPLINVAINPYSGNV
jgi:hypothetical protein